MPLTVVRRKQTGAITISGTIRLMGGLTMRVQRRAASNDPALAAEEASVLEAEILRYDVGMTNTRLSRKKTAQ